MSSSNNKLNSKSNINDIKNVQLVNSCREMEPSSNEVILEKAAMPTNENRIILPVFVCVRSYCETHKTVNTRNIYGMLLCCEK